MKTNRQKEIDSPLYIPAKLYHGTNAQFEIFDLYYKGTNTEWRNTVHGFYFTEVLDHASMFGERVLTCELSIGKPLNIVLHEIFSIESQASVIWEILSGEIVKPKRALKILDEEIGLGEIGDLYDTLHYRHIHTGTWSGARLRNYFALRRRSFGVCGLRAKSSENSLPSFTAEVQQMH